MGVVGFAHYHMMKITDEQKRRSAENQHIDIAAESKERALERIQLGDYAVVDSPFVEMRENASTVFLGYAKPPVVLVTGKKADGAWELQLLGTGKTLEPMNGWKVMDSSGAQAKLEVKDGELRLTEDKGVQIGSLLTRQPDWTQARSQVRSAACCGSGALQHARCRGVPGTYTALRNYANSL